MRPGWPDATRRIGLAALLLAVLFGIMAGPALAQAHNPFGVGISEGGGNATGIVGWLMQQQVLFERQLSAAVRATRQDGSAMGLLAGLSFAYGVFHAAGPGHGKAVIASYLFANERALRRGLILSVLAALMQSCVAIGLVGFLALVLHATAPRMKDAASLIESLSYAGVAVLGAWLLWRKGWDFVAAFRSAPGWRQQPATPITPAIANPNRVATASCDCGLSFWPSGMQPVPSMARTALVAEPVGAGPAHGHGAHCGHYHGPDPSSLGDNFSWREAVLTVAAAGSRPCSGAILVLVFSLSQGIFATGILAALTMGLGVALTTGALASVAVLAKTVALRISGPGSRRGTLVIKGLEALAALLVLLAGLSLFLGFTAVGGA